MAKERFTTPVGRFVQGDLDEPQTKDAQGALRVVKSGPNAGQPNPQYFIAVAFPKADPQGEFAAFYGMLVAKAAADFPGLFPNAARGDYACAHPSFAYKVIDGDGVDTTGKSNATKPGFAGHWVVRFASGFPPRCFHAGHYQPHEQIQEKGAIKRGYYVRVSGTVEGNANPQKPGLYVNLDMVELAAICPPDQLIVSGPSADDAFGAGHGGGTGGAQALPHTPPAPGAPAVPAAAPPPPAAGPVMLPAAQGATYESMIAAGWTDETLVAHGMMQAPPPPYAGYMAPAAPGNAPAPPAASPSLPPSPGAPSAPAAIPSPTSAPPPPAPGRVMLAAANGSTYEQMIAAGWTDALLVERGMMAA
jgi:hypothetical protein